MPFDSPTRNKLARMVSEAKKILLEEFTSQLQEIHGIQPDGKITDLKKLVHLDNDQLSIALLLRERIEHLINGMSSEKNPKATAVDRVIREQAFTILHRFSALRMCEERGIIQECIGQGMQSKGFQVYSTVAGSAIGPIYEKYRTFLFLQFDEIAIDLGILFDRNSPHGLLFPREQALLALLQILNNADLKSIWTEDETIGWIYQYFNSQEERKAMRYASAVPRNSRELAVRNQFFTPRYVVEFLTDNTLGRIWYEMRKGDTALKEECRYLVHRPKEVFLAPNEKAPAVKENEADLSQEELIKQPVYIEHREKKDPRDLRVLDPACGSGHFLLYAFDLLEQIYQEAWSDPKTPMSECTGHTLQKDFETRENLRKAAPKLIIENNLHGIDIDPRAVQIATLALWLRAQRYWLAQGLKIEDRPRITRSNIVCAEPMPGDEKMRREFIENLKPRVIGQLVDVIFNKMELAGEAGSLLKIEEEIKESVANARKQWQEIPKPEQQLLFPEIENRRPKQQEFRFDLREITEDKFWEQAENLILEALKDYAEQVENGRSVRRRLFVEDTARGFAFIELCRRRYDVVLMNPPFGEVSVHLSDYLARKYPTWNKNILCAFIEQGYQMSHPNGATAAIYDRTAIVKSTYEDFRRTVLISDNRLSAMADLGWGVLDANVEVTTSILHHQPASDRGVFIDSRDVDVDNKGPYILDSIRSFYGGLEKDKTFCEKGSSFRHLPNAVVGYDFPEFLIAAFKECSSLEQSGFKANQGHALKADKHFRLWWEIPKPTTIGFVARMFNGSGFAPYFTILHDCVVAHVSPESLPKDSATVIRNREVQLLPGICFGKRGEFFCTHVLPKGHIFTVEGQSISIREKDNALNALALLNTPLVRFSLNKYCGQHKYSGYVNLFPYRQLSNIEACKTRIELVINTIREAQRFDETQSLFSITRLGTGIADRASLINRLVDSARNLCFEAETFCHEESIRTYKLSKKERKEIENFRSRQPNVESPISDVDLPSGCKWFAAHTEISTIVGTVFGRWDARIALDPSLAPNLPDPFDPLPVSPPMMLVGPDGLPAESGSIVSEEWLRARPNANNLSTEGTVKNSTIPDSEYSLRINWDGILVDDSFNQGHSHQEDIVNRIREILDFLWKDKAHEIEQEACEILGVAKLRDYFRKPSGFFEDHLKRYSKSRRKAPIYWPLSTASGSYTLWIYYHRLTDQTLFACVNDFVNPRMEEVSKEIDKVHVDLRLNPSARNRKLLENLMGFQQELKDLKDELLRVANLPYKPDLNDGVLITACPLWKLFLHNRWRKDLEDCWKKLNEGEYDWAHLAYAVWPDRVEKVCETDHSIAIAHNLESLHQGEIRQKSVKRKRKG